MEIKDYLKNILANMTYYFVDSQNKQWAYFRVTKKKNLYQLEGKKGIPLVTHPFEYDNIPASSESFKEKTKLYDGLVKFFQSVLDAGYQPIGTQEDFTDFLFGYEDDDYETALGEINWSAEVVLDGITYRCDAFNNHIGVSKVHIKNNKFTDEFLYKLWYENPIGVKDAMEKSLANFDDNSKRYFAEFKELLTYIKTFSKSGRKDIPLPESIVFEHLVTLNKDVVSGLSCPIPDTEFVPFNSNIQEEGKLYFWTSKSGKLSPQTKIYFFVLQNREENVFHISQCELKEFNEDYYQSDYLMTYHDEIENLKNTIAEENWKEISQDDVIAYLTKKKAKEVLNQDCEFSVYLEDIVFDVYENMIVHWVHGEDIEEKVYHTYFFDSTNKRDHFLKNIIAEYESDDFGASTFEQEKHTISFFKNIQSKNKNFLEEKVIKDAFLSTHPEVKALLKGKHLRYFMDATALKIIEGDWVVNGDLVLEANKESIVILGDLKVSGTLLFTSDWPENSFLVLGNIMAKNIIFPLSYKSALLKGDMIAEDILVLPSGRQNWEINTKGIFKTNIIIHASESVADKGIQFEKEYSTKDNGILKNEVKNSKYQEIYHLLKKGNSLFLKETKDEDAVKKERFLRQFKDHLREWHSLYYEFAGFELEELPIGEHYGHHIESDQIIKDIRHDTGLYLMDHDTLLLELVKANKPLPENRISSQQLAYRFFWIMWTFSSWKHRDDGPMSYWKSNEKIEKAFARDKDFFQEDIHVALYWLMHFGLLEDSRYEEVVALIGDNEHHLIQGAILFFASLKEDKAYPIKIDYKEDNQLFKDRILHHKYEIEKAKVSNAIHLTLSQFEVQPKKVLTFINELYESKQWDNIKEYLDKNQYAVGHSYLHIFVSKDKAKWRTQFIQEAVEHVREWDENYLLLDMIEIIFKELNFSDREQAITILLNSSISSTSKMERFQTLMNYHKDKGEDLDGNADQSMSDYVASINVNQFDFQDFVNRMDRLSGNKKMKLIEYCVKQDKFSDKCGKGPICHYLVLYWVEDFFRGSDEEKRQMAEMIVNGYNLSIASFFANDSMTDSPKNEQTALFKMIQKHLK